MPFDGSDSDFLRIYQERCRRGRHIQPQVHVLSHLALGLCGEAGEVADQIKKSQYDGRVLDIEKLVLEAGDVLWYLGQIAYEMGLSIEDIAQMNLNKLAERRPDLYADLSA